ncbi:hypothetical protein PTKIN_Ptkin01aG0105400 [Pterospermum kingtungense]
MPETGQAYACELGFTFDMNNSSSSGTYILSRPKSNSTYSMLQVEPDGNLKIYAYGTMKKLIGEQHEGTQ